MRRNYNFRSVLSKEDIEGLFFDNESKIEKINKNFLAVAIILLVIALNRILLESYNHKVAVVINMMLFILGCFLIVKNIFLARKVADNKKVLSNLLGQQKRFEMVRGCMQPKKKICVFLTKHKLEAARNMIRKHGVDECISLYRQDLHRLDIMRVWFFMVVWLIQILNLVIKAVDSTPYQIPISIVLGLNVILLIMVLVLIQKIYKQQTQSDAYELVLKEELEEALKESKEISND